MSAKPDAEIEVAIDRLYQSALDQFVVERNALVADLRKSGNREGADRIKALAKPGVTAWAINQAWWRDRPAFRAMLESGTALRNAHVKRATGSAADVRAAAEARQQAIDAVIETAIEVLGGPDAVAPEMRYRIAGTLDALASSGPPPDVTLGRLTKDLHSTGLDALSALAGVAPPPRAAPPAPPRPVIVSRSEPKPARSKTDENRARQAEAAARDRAARLAQAKTQLAARQQALKSAEADAADKAKLERRARAALEAAAAEVVDLEQRLEAARQQEREARRVLAQATKAGSGAEMTRARTVRDVNAARAQLEQWGEE
ncbi:MAG: hypothetical protein LC791_13715 [Acidobacteria bacterium]|nr:hypothetical protein [Acidobacteriota bacterium]